MPTYVDATVELLDYSDFLEYAATSLEYDGQTEMLQHISQELRANPYNAQSSLNTQEQWAEAIMQKLRNNGYEIQYNGNNQWTGSVFPTTPQVNNTNPVNSNIGTISRGNVRNYYGGLNEFGQTGLQTWVPQRFPVSGGLGSKAMYAVTSVGSAIGAVSTGIWLGKTIDSALYNANPDYWDSIGMSSLNPQTWGTITNGDDSPFAGLFNFILGIDGDNGTAQMYADQTAIAYMALALKEAGFFLPTTESVQSKPSGFSSNVDAFIPFTINSPVQCVQQSSRYIDTTTIYADYTYMIFYRVLNGNLNYYVVICNDSSVTAKIYTREQRVYRSDGSIAWDTVSSVNASVSSSYTFNGKKVYYTYSNSGVGSSSNPVISYDGGKYLGTSYPNDLPFKELAWLSLYNHVTDSPVDGVGNQPEAQLPDTSTWNDIPSTLQSLQNQYPDAFQNPMVWNNDTPYDDSTGNQKIYIPIPFPSVTSATDTQPTSGPQTQTSIQLNDVNQAIRDIIPSIVQQTSTQPAIPPTNPTDTGTGNTPVPVAPTGNSSALWSVYHPTQAQINSFGAWLWGSPFLTNIGKLFQNPIDGVISLHKIYVTPVDSGTDNIVVGTLDSGVSSATVNQQYVTVDCGSINCYEDFGNVFDYEPYTKLSIYLPFIGIVPLNVSDVMRSTVHVKYGVDVYTGACIAMIELSRDGGTINMYQYTGNCAVHYPLSNVQQSNLISGLLSIAAGVGSVLATGGVSAPAVLGIAGGALSSGHTSIGRSGGFSANAGAMGIKKPYLIIERPQTKVAKSFPILDGYPTNYSIKLGDCSNHVVCKTVHISGINATDSELAQIEQLLKDGIEI